MRHVRLAVGAVPQIDLEAAAALEQDAAVHIGVAPARELVAHQVRVVRRLNKVLGERQREVLVCGEGRLVEHHI